MNCEECQPYISALLDTELDERVAVRVREHVAGCLNCEKLFRDLSEILVSCQDVDAVELMPPNSRALWCRINNLIESEVPPPAALVEERPRRWKAFTWARAALAVGAIAIASSLLTVIALQFYDSGTSDPFSRAGRERSTFAKFLGRAGLAESPFDERKRRIEEQQAAIEYWNKRVQQRRALWDRNLREGFDRNLAVIDQAVTEYTQILQNDPEDELSGEMLDSVLNEKMNLLREFSEL
jgi:hypothetical protein